MRGISLVDSSTNSTIMTGSGEKMSMSHMDGVTVMLTSQYERVS